MYYKPKEIAKHLNVSTSALRHYESWGIVPAPERTKNGYRLYTEVHFAYFRCIRAMFPAVNMRAVSKILLYIQQKDVDAAFWVVNEEQARLHQEKVAAEHTLKMLHHPNLENIDNMKVKDEMRIGEVAHLTGVTTSAIRHWEKENLITPYRHSENGYRIYTRRHLRQIFLIRAVRNTVYSLDSIKEMIKSLEHRPVQQATRVTQEALESINHRNRSQLHGMHELYGLCEMTGLLGENSCY
ncbi:MerR family transcriptional regulator [Salicibibacter cibi]|uniref:MerR family transcriptional regulator n=1 Tax=Salicibibacter cibi TaxID=2743001 RepID=A0A7T6ZC58_9BACI|nr:MerR family transcriptional regulator [Salicibibacter cibi]QQK80799.1 MerR family transcriptional regulator [Salicibibacter cibi]